MALKRLAVLAEGIDQEILAGSGYLLALLWGSPSGRSRSHGDEMSSCMHEGAEHEVILYSAIALAKALDDPETSVNVLVQLELPQLGNHLAKIFGADAKLGHFPVDDSHGYLLVIVDGLVRQQDATHQPG